MGHSPTTGNDRNNGFLVVVAMMLVVLTITLLVLFAGPALVWGFYAFGFGQSNTLVVEPQRVNESGQIRIPLPGTDQPIRFTFSDADAVSSQDYPTTKSDGENQIMIPAGYCRDGCTIRLTVDAADELDLVVTYEAGESEYVDDIEIDYE